jgi:hypothetical protein
VNLAHVGDVKKAGGLAGCLMFLQEAGKLYGKIPACEGDHAGPGGQMAVG